MRTRELLRKFTPDRHIFAASVSANVLAFALPLLMLQIYDRVIPHKGYETLTVLAIGVLTAIILELVLRMTRAQLMGLAGDAYERDMQAQVFERLLKTELSVVEKQSAGVYMDQLSSIEKIREFRHGETAVAALDLPFSVVFLGIVAVISPIMAGVIMVFTLCAMMIMRVLHRQATALSEKRHEIDRRRFSFLIEVLEGIESIKSFNLEAFMERRYERLSSSAAHVGAESTRRNNFSQAVTGSIGAGDPGGDRRRRGDPGDRQCHYHRWPCRGDAAGQPHHSAGTQARGPAGRRVGHAARRGGNRGAHGVAAPGEWRPQLRADRDA